MAVNWNNLASAAACLLEYERLCDRRSFIEESSLVRASAEFIQSTTQLLLTPEYNHPDLLGNKRLDLLGRTREEAPASFVLEAKWIKADGGTRQWAKEIGEDILRLENIERDVNAQTDRAIVVGGIKRSLYPSLIDVRVNPGAGMSRVEILPHLLQPRDVKSSAFPYAQEKKPIRDCEDGARKFWCALAVSLGRELPVSYQCSLAGWHSSGSSQDAVEVFVWLVRRSRNRSTFDAVASLSSV
jgi:hypothetical protein